MRRTPTAAAMALLVVLAGCAGALGPAADTTGGTPVGPTATSGDATGGSVDFYISDEKNAIGDFEHLNVTVTKIGFLPADDEAEDADETEDETTSTATEDDDGNGTTVADDEEMENETTAADGETTVVTTAEPDDDEGDDGEWVLRDVDDATVDLTQYQGANATKIANFSLPEGEYEKVFIYVDNVSGTLKGGESVNVKLPSGKIQLNEGFTVGNNESVDFVFDLTVHEAGNSGKYILKPVASESGTDVPIEAREHAPEDTRDRDHDRDGEDEARDGQDDDDGSATDGGEATGLALSLRGPVTAGENVTVAVTSGGDPVANATVSVNGETVGETDADGTVSVTVPDAEEMEVTATDGDAEVEIDRRVGGSGDGGGGQSGEKGN